jgi:hypothetical protein
MINHQRGGRSVTLMRSEGRARCCVFDANAVTAARPPVSQRHQCIDGKRECRCIRAFFEDLSAVVSTVAPISGPII